MRTYPHPLEFRVMQQGHTFIIEQFCGTAGWWPVGETDSLQRAKEVIELAKKEQREERKQVWP